MANETNQTMQCNMCGRVLPLNMFDKDPHGRNGLHRQCKDCRRDIREAKKQETNQTIEQEAKKQETNQTIDQLEQSFEFRVEMCANAAYHYTLCRMSNGKRGQNRNKTKDIQDICKDLGVTNSTPRRLIDWIEDYRYKCATMPTYDIVKAQARIYLISEGEDMKKASALKKLRNALKECFGVNVSLEQINKETNEIYKFDI